MLFGCVLPSWVVSVKAQLCASDVRHIASHDVVDIDATMAPGWLRAVVVKRYVPSQCQLCTVGCIC